MKIENEKARAATTTKRAMLIAGLSIFLLGLSIHHNTASGALPPKSSSAYAADGSLRFPEHYREWVFLSAGFDMSYSQMAQMDHHMFDNVFVNPEAYDFFVKNGKWPDKTVLVLESRRAESKGSINKAGNYQSEVMGISAHVRDEKKFPGKWAFFAFGTQKNSKLLPVSADCYSCHGMSGAVDTTFVQFYPTLLPIAKDKGTLIPTYKSE
jgi:hypothetical protein